MGPVEGLHLRDFLDRVSLLHAVFLCTRCCPPSKITYIYMPELLYSILISFSLLPLSFSGSSHLLCTIHVPHTWIRASQYYISPPFDQSPVYQLDESIAKGSSPPIPKFEPSKAPSNALLRLGVTPAIMFA